MKSLILVFLMSLFAISCGEEVLTQSTLDEGFTATNIQAFELNTCSQMTFEKPPVDLLFVVDNSGSSLLPSFNNIKQQIRNTINTISGEFDYHIYITPLIALPGDSLTQYQTIVSDTSTLVHPITGNSTVASVNVTTPENISFFSQATGNNDEHGFTRAEALVSANRNNGIFRKRANTIIVNISNGDDNEAIQTINGNAYFNPSVFSNLKNSLLKFSKKYSDVNSVSNPLQAESLRYISLVAHSNCDGWRTGANYKRMSRDIYDYMGHTDDPSSKDSQDLCSGNYSTLFSAINNSIKAVVVGHKYDHWKISNANSSQIQEDEITVSKVSPNGNVVNIPIGSVNGFQYLGYRSNQNTRYEPTPGEPTSGLMIKLNGSARVNYPECIIAKTVTPTEFFGFLALPREPQPDSIRVLIRGQEISQSSTNGWGYIGWREVKNIKVPGPTGASILPALNKTGYFIQLYGNTIFTNGDTIQVYYKPASL
jgi:hypothetical protein